MLSHLLSKQPAPRLADWGWNVSVCVIAVADAGKSICVVTDSKAAFGKFSADKAARKHLPLIYHYTIVFAGNDAAYAGPVINRARKRLTMDGKTTSSADEISECIFEECQRERNRITEAEILSPRGYDLATFKTQGKELCTDAVFYDIQSEMQKKTLSLDFIIAGFDEKNEAHIRFTNCKTPPEDYDSIGFWAIGTGAQAALASLSHAVEYLGMNTFWDAETVLYHTLAAKFMSESARDVGKATADFVLGAGGASTVRYLHSFGGVEYLREQWQKYGAPRIPKMIKATIAALLVDDIKQTFSKEKLTAVAKHSPEARKMLKFFKENEAKKLAAQKSTSEQ
jgi:hypothetical protein